MSLSLLRPAPLFGIAAALRLVLLLYGAYQDAHSALKYTDIDYLVFTDAARYVRHGLSPYARETYRYSPLLAWLLLPTALRPSALLFSFGKLFFAAADLLAGWLILLLLRRRRRGGGKSSGSGSDVERDGAFAALWLWNPMVATISTRGSSEGLLGVLTVGLLWAVERRRIALAGAVLGLAVHFKIYPFIYAPAIIWWMDEEHMRPGSASPSAPSSLPARVIKFCSKERITLTLASLATFTGLNALMYYMCVFFHLSLLFSCPRLLLLLFSLSSLIVTSSFHFPVSFFVGSTLCSTHEITVTGTRSYFTPSSIMAPAWTIGTTSLPTTPFSTSPRHARPRHPFGLRHSHSSHSYSYPAFSSLWSSRRRT